MPRATFALNPQMLDEYAYLSVPRVLVPAKAILKSTLRRPKGNVREISI